LRYKVEGTVETEIETLPLSVDHTLRQRKSAPVVQKFKEWVETLLPGTPPNSALGKALAYYVRQWPKLVLFLGHADAPMHNNFVERQIKQYALGRRLWMFCYDKVGAQASANLFSLVMTGASQCGRAVRVSERGIRAVTGRNDGRNDRGTAALESRTDPGRTTQATRARAADHRLRVFSRVALEFLHVTLRHRTWRSEKITVFPGRLVSVRPSRIDTRLATGRAGGTEL
jgi:hypothetical protein